MKTLAYSIRLLFLAGLILVPQLVQAVTLNKGFNPVSIKPGNTTNITVYIYNDQTSQLTNAGWSDSLPEGMTVAGAVITNTCGGTVTASIGSSVINLTGGTVPAKVGSTNGECIVVVPVTTTVQGNSDNTIPAYNLTNNEYLTNNDDNFTNKREATATLNVASFTKPSLSTTLNPSTIYLGQTATLTANVTNNDANSSLTQTGWFYTLPAGLQVNGAPITNGNCGSPTLTGTTGGSAIGMSGATIIKGGTICTVTIPITGSAQGNYTINLPAGTITSYQGVTNDSASTQAIAVQSFSVTSKTFSPSTVRTNQVSTMTINLSSVAAYTDLAFTDNFSGQGLVIANPSNKGTTCGSGTVTAVPGTSVISLSGGAFPSGGTYINPATCIVQVDVVVPLNADAGTDKTNTIAVGSVTGKLGAITASNINAVSAAPTMTVTGYTAPTFTTKSFSNTAPKVGEILTLTIAVKNNDTGSDFTNLHWSDTLPSGLQVATGTQTWTGTGCTGTITAPLSVDAGTISVDSATIPKNTTCTVTVPILANRQGTFSNSAIPAGNITNDQGTTNTTASPSSSLTSSTFTVVKKLNGNSPTANMSTNTATKLRIEITNKSTDSYYNLGFTDNFTVNPSTLPTTFTIANPTNAVTTCNATGTPAAVSGITSGATSFSFSGGTLAAGNASNTTVTCYVEVDVIATATFTSKLNTIASVTALADGNGILSAGSNSAASAVSAAIQNLTISAANVARPTISTKSFTPNSIVVGSGTSTLRIDVKNNDLATTLTNVAWTDTFPVGVVWTGGAITYTGCGTTRTVTITHPTTQDVAVLGGGVSLAPSGICRVDIPVKTTKQGAFNNQILSGAVTSDQINSNAASSAPLTSTSLTAAKVFRNAANTIDVTDINAGDTVKLKITITNPSTTESYNSLAFTDSFANFTATVGGGPALQIASTPNAQTTCVSGGVLTAFSDPSLAGSSAVANSQSISLAGGVLAASSSCYVIVDVTALAAMSQKTNTIVQGTLAGNAGEIKALSDSNGSKAWKGSATTANLTIGSITPPTFSAKAFCNTNPLYVGQTCNLDISVKNNDGTATLNNVSWTDVLQTGLVSAGAVSIRNTITDCGPTAIASPTNLTTPSLYTDTNVSGNTVIHFGGGTIAPGKTCNVRIPIKATNGGNYSNTIGICTISNNENACNTAPSPTASISVKSLEIVKSFLTSPISVGGISTLRIDVTNNTTTAYSGIGLTDTLPAGLVIAPAPNIVKTSVSSCTTLGTVTAAAGDNQIILSGFAIGAGTSSTKRTCRVQVDVIGNTSGSYPNTIPAGAFDTAITPATQNLAQTQYTLVVNPPTLTANKTFTPISIGANGTDVSLLRITITNPNVNLAINSLSFTDTFPPSMNGLVISNASAPNKTCAGTLTATHGTNVISFSGTVSDTLATAASCYIEVPVVATAAFNNQSNSVTVTAQTSANESVTSNTATANLTATALNVTKAFTSPTLAVGNTTRLTITINNNLASAQSNVTFTDNFPPGSGTRYILVSGTPAISNNCNGTVTVLSGSTGFSLAGGSIPANTSCSVSLAVIGNQTSGSAQTNTITVTSSQQTTGVSASDTINVITPTVLINNISKTFSPDSITLLENSTAEITWSSSSNADTVDPIVTDNLPIGLTVSTVPNVTASCSGIQPTIASTTISPTRSQIVVALTKIQVKNETCSISFSVTPSKPGLLTNTIAIGDIVSVDGSAVSTVNASAELTVTNVLTISKTFQPTVLGPNGTAVLTITLTNPETLVLTGTSLTDYLPNNAAPNNLEIADPSNASTNCTEDGSASSSLVTAIAGTRAITLSNGVIPPKVGSVNGICTITVTVKPHGSYSTGTATNTIATGTVSTTEERTNYNATSDSISFTTPSLGVVKDFDPHLVTGGTVSKLTVTISNPATYTQSGLSFTDVMPTGMTIGSPPNPQTTCAGGSFSGVTIGSGIWSFSGGSVAANSDCTVSVNATSSIDGNLTNPIEARAVTSVNGGANSQAARASLSNLPGASIGKSFLPNPARVNEVIRLSITVTNSSSSTAVTNMRFSDDLTLGGTQSGLTVASVPDISNSCGGTVSTTSTSISLAGGSLAKQATCTLSINIVSNTVGSYTNTIAAENLQTNEGITNLLSSSDTVPVYASIRAVKQLSPTSDAGRFILTMTPSAPTGSSVRSNVGHDSDPATVSAFFANEGTTYTITESGQGATDLNNYVSSYLCVNANGIMVASGSGTSVSVTPPTAASGATKNQQDITCTFTNIRKTTQASVTLKKTWVGALVNDAVTLTGTGLTTLNSVANLASETDTGVTEILPVNSMITLQETFTHGSSSNYNSSFACTGTSGLSGNVLTIGNTDSAIVCTFTSIRSTASTVTLQKQWSGADLNDEISFTATRSGTTISTLNSTAITANQFDAATPVIVNTGDEITLNETFSTGLVNNYTFSLECTGSSGLSGNTLIVGDSDLTIVCTATNVRKTANVTLKKQWVNASVGDAVDVTGTGSSPLTTLHSVANTANQIDTSITTDTVNTGSVITLSENFITGSPDHYIPSWSCTGTSGLTDNILTIGTDDTAIVCTVTNTRKTARLTLKKQWLNANVGDTVILTSDGTHVLNSVASAANDADSSTEQTVNTDEIITLDEYFQIGSPGNYTSTIGCTNNSNNITPDLSGTNHNILTILDTYGTVVCTFTNTRIATITGTVFEDSGLSGGTANNGTQDGGESGVYGATVKLTNCNTTIYDTVTSNANGNYALSTTNVFLPTDPVGTTKAVCVVETNESGYISTGGSPGTTGGNYNRMSDSIAFTLSKGYSYTGLNFGDVITNAFNPNNIGQGAAGSVVFYAHNFISMSVGTVSFTTSRISSPSSLTWSEVLYRDTDCDAILDSGEPRITTGTSITTAVDSTLCILVKEFIPANANSGATNVVTITANFTYTGANPALTATSLIVTDTTTSGTATEGVITLNKTVDKPAAIPGSILVYTITYTNVGATAVSNLVINDAVPAYTKLKQWCCAVLAQTDCVLGTSIAPTCTTTTCTTGTTPTTCAANLDSNTGLKWTFDDALAPGQSGNVKYSVQVEQ